MTPAVARETRVEKRDAAKAYLGLSDAAFARLARRFRRKIDPVEFVLLWRDGASASDIAERFDLRREDYVTQARRALGCPPRAPGGRTQ
jgi:hypothetical protein